MPDTTKAEARAFEAKTLDKFKGVNSSQSLYPGTGGNNGYGGDEKEAKILKNLNITPEGFLEKRKGLALFGTLPSNAVHAQYVGQLINLNLRKIWLYFSDGASLWRIDDTGAGLSEVKMEVSNNFLGGIASVLQVGNPGNQYNGIGVSATAGVIGMYGANPLSTNGWLSGSPKGDRALMFKNRGWVINTRDAGTAGNETRLYFSGVSNLGDWTAGGASGGGNFQIDVADGDNLSGMIIYNDNIILFKTKKTYSFTADGDPSNWTYRVISDRVGCVGHHTIRSIAGFLYFLSADGVYKTDGTTYQLISEPVYEYLQGYHNYWDPLSNNNISAVYYDNKYILFVSKDLNAADQALVYDIPTEQWSVWDFDQPRTGITVLGAVRLGDRATDKLVVGSWSQRRLWVMDTSYQDNGVDMICTWQSRRQDFGDMINKKRNHMVAATVSHDPNAPVGGYGSEITITSKLPQSNEAYTGNNVSGQKFIFNAVCDILGVEFFTPEAAGSGSYEVSVWSEMGTTLYRQYYGQLNESGAGWHKIYFDTPFRVTVTTPIPTYYMISVGYPVVGTNNRGYCHVAQTTINQAPILNGSNNAMWQLNALRGFPNTQYNGQDNNFTMLGPIVAIADSSGVTIETVADDTTTVTTTLPVAKMSDRLIKAKGAGYGRYFQTKVTYRGSGPFALYGITWMNEVRGIQPNAGPNRAV